jgi:PmbA protein
MSEELKLLAASALGATVGAGASSAEAYAQDADGIEVRVYEGEVEALTESAERGVGVRAWIDGRAGYAYGTDLSGDGVRAIAAGAVEAARVADPDEFAGPPEDAEGAPDVEGLHDPTLAGWGTESKVQLAQEVERAARADRRVVAIEDTVYADESQRVAIASSSGASGAYESTSCYAYARAIAADDGDDRQTGLGFEVARGPGSLDAGAVGGEAAERAVSLLGASKPASRTGPVVLDQTVAASFIGFIGGVLCADAVQRGRSPFAGRLGDEIASAAVTLTDNGLDPEGPASAPFDGEGTPHGRTPLIEAGTLRTYLHDSYTARREGDGQASTGNAARAGYRSAPSVSTSNLLIAEGERSLEELLADAADGVYVTDVAGLHSGVNPVSGTFSVGASGRRIESGELAAAHTEFTIASDLASMLAAVRAASRPARWVPFGGSVKAPALLIGEMAVGGS